MSFERIAEQRLRQAMADGEFDDLRNAGQPIDLEEYFSWPESVRMAYSVLKNARCVPVEVELLNEIARLRALASVAGQAGDRDAIRKTLADRRIELAIRLERSSRTRGAGRCS